jgi:thioredoxin-dependent peroxiredoxin
MGCMFDYKTQVLHPHTKLNMSLSIGSKAPRFLLPSSSGKNFDLEVDYLDKPLVIFFYPADFTRGCTTEVCSFRDSFEVFKGYDVDIIGISKDSVATHKRFKTEYKLPFELLSDPKQEVTKKYKALFPIFNITKRITYLLDKSHTIVAVYDNLFLAKSHIDEMMKKVKAGTVS